MRMQFFEQWKKACEKAGLDQPSYEHGLDLRNGQKAAKYVAKWGLEHEMTKGHIKRVKQILKRLSIYSVIMQRVTKMQENYLGFTLKHSRYTPIKLVKRFEKTLQQGPRRKNRSKLVDETDNVAELMFKLSIELWNPIRKHGRQGELLIKVQEDHT